MTEADWLTCEDPMAMLEFLVGKVSDRKFRLFAVACCRRVQEHIVDQRCIRALAILEENINADRYDPCFQMAADNAWAVRHERHYQVLASCVGEDLARQAAGTSTGSLWGLTDETTAKEAIAKAESDPICCAANAVWVAAGAGDPSDDEGFASYRAEIAALHAATAGGDENAERLIQSQIARDIFGNPFRPVAADPSWRTSTVVALARQMYESRDFSPMPVLADALQDAGCEHPDVLDHCRGAGPHVRGCWVVDLILGKQ